jgi:hypothetical protein
MAGDRTHPVCGNCGERIGVYEPLWLQFSDGTVASTSLLKLDGEPRSNSDHVLLHVGCFIPGEIQHAKAS